MSQSSFRRAAGLASNTMAKLHRDEPAEMVVLEKTCATLDADYADIVDYVKEPEQYVVRPLAQPKESPDYGTVKEV